MQPLLYHTHHNQYLEDLPFWLGLAEQHGSPILELGCGTGRIMLPLIEAGYQVTGLDISAAMLQQLKTLAAQDEIDPPDLVQGDLSNFSLERNFSLILLPCNTYSTLSKSQRQSALNCIREHLTPGGVFATSVPNPTWVTKLEAIEEVEVETVFIHPETGNPVQASNEWHSQAGQLEICWHYDHLLPDGQVERFSQATSHFLTPAEEYFEELKNSGFKTTSYGDFNLARYAQDQPYLIIEAAITEI
ncbi:MAG: methyltransferase domain-containing protein [Chloroflexota bacterium]